jgi:hypothetical protein
VVSFTPRSLYPQGKSSRYTLDRRLGGSQNRSGRGGEEKNSQPLAGLETPIIQPVAQRYTTELSRLLNAIERFPIWLILALGSCSADQNVYCHATTMFITVVTKSRHNTAYWSSWTPVTSSQRISVKQVSIPSPNPHLCILSGRLYSIYISFIHKKNRSHFEVMNTFNQFWLYRYFLKHCSFPCLETAHEA